MSEKDLTLHYLLHRMDRLVRDVAILKEEHSRMWAALRIAWPSEEVDWLAKSMSDPETPMEAKDE